VSKTEVSEKRRGLIYILAPSYTGSTLLTFLMAKHPAIATIGELKATARGDLDSYSCSCGSLQRECSFWKRVTEEMREYNASFTLEDFGTHFCVNSPLTDRLLRASVRNRAFELARTSMLHLLPGSRNRLQGILQRNQQIIEVICNLQHAEVFLDGSKDPIRLKLLKASGYWEVRTIYLIRDGRGATNSYMRHYDVSMEIAATEWYRTHQECDRLVRGLGTNACVTIHYEDLCRRPEDTLAKIYRFLGLSVEADDSGFRAFDHHILGNEMRLRSIDEVRLDEKWKTVLTECDLQVFEDIAGSMNRHYGYG